LSSLPPACPAKSPRSRTAAVGQARLTVAGDGLRRIRTSPRSGWRRPGSKLLDTSESVARPARRRRTMRSIWRRRKAAPDPPRGHARYSAPENSKRALPHTRHRVARDRAARTGHVQEAFRVLRTASRGRCCSRTDSPPTIERGRRVADAVESRGLFQGAAVPESACRVLVRRRSSSRLMRVTNVPPEAPPPAGLPLPFERTPHASGQLGHDCDYIVRTHRAGRQHAGIETAHAQRGEVWSERPPPIVGDFFLERFTVNIQRRAGAARPGDLESGAAGAKSIADADVAAGNAARSEVSPNAPWNRGYPRAMRSSSLRATMR